MEKILNLMATIIKPFHLEFFHSESIPLAKASSTSKIPIDFFNENYVNYFFSKGRPNFQLGGLENMGYSCYLNSILQCLSYTPGFRQFCQELPNSLYLANESDAFFLDSLGKTFDQMEHKKAYLPEWVIQDLGYINEVFATPTQQDAHELLIFLLERLDYECQKAMVQPGPTFISQLFSGYIKTTISCSSCGFSVDKTNKFYDFSIPILQQSSMTEA